MTLAILHFLILFHFVFSDVGSLGKKVREGNQLFGFL